MTVESSGELFRQGRLDDAIEAAGAAVKARPTDLSARVLLAELLLFTGDLARADAILDAAIRIDPDSALVVSEFRQLIRAETARRQILQEGRAPDLIGEPTEAMRHLLASLVAGREGDAQTAAREADAAEQARPRAAGTMDDVAFDDWRDADDLSAGHFEFLTVTGKCFWIATERVLSAEFHAPVRARDLIWRRASVMVQDGPEGDVYTPALYVPVQAGEADPIRLGRETTWSETRPVRGSGQRTYLAGEEAVAAQAIGVLAFG